VDGQPERRIWRERLLVAAFATAQRSATTAAYIQAGDEPAS
jgi:hypothetical protein